MKIAIDESGDVGRKLWKGSSRWFVVAAAIVPDSYNGCGPICQAVSTYQQQHMEGVELHYSKNSHEQHLEFLKYMHDKDYVFAAVAIDKRRLLTKKPHVLRSKMTLLQYAFDNLFSQLQPWIDKPIVILDTNGSRHFNRALQRHLLQRFGSRHKGDVHTIQDVITVDSRSEPLVQLADYVAGAVRHHVDTTYTANTFDLYVSDKGKIFFAS